LLRLVANRAERSLHLFLNGQVDFALGVVDFALLSDQVGLGLRLPVRSPPAIYLQQCPILLVELRGFEPLTSAVRLRRSPN
jgi:hypothetical protein